MCLFVLLPQLVGESLLNSMASGELAAAGLPYLHIRSLAVPAVLLCMVAQGACIGRQDSRTPMSIFLAAGLVNCVLDLYLVLPTGLNMGLAGAAWATLAAQYGAAVSFLIVLHRRGHLPEVRAFIKLTSPARCVSRSYGERSPMRNEKACRQASHCPEAENLEVRLGGGNPSTLPPPCCGASVVTASVLSILSHRKEEPLAREPALSKTDDVTNAPRGACVCVCCAQSWHIPKARNLLKFMNVSGMLLLGSVCRMGVYTLLTVAATMSGVVTVAAHQIALQVRECCLCEQEGAWTESCLLPRVNGVDRDRWGCGCVGAWLRRSGILFWGGLRGRCFGF